MHDLAYQLKQLAYRNKDGSYQTQADRLAILLLIAQQLVASGYKQMQATDVKHRHAQALVTRWKAEQLSGATIRNRLAVLRWWAEKVGRASALPKTNDVFDLEPRQFVARTSKATTLPEEKLQQIRDPYVRMSLELQREFGLRRAEAILIIPVWADGGHQLRLQKSWTKGGRERVIPFSWASQRETLERAKTLAGSHSASLIPAHLQYVQQEKRYEDWTRRVGLSQNHGLRHAYAHRRFLELTGFPCPAAGGPTLRELTPAQHEADGDARALITEEMGHSRLQITSAYLGR